MNPRTSSVRGAFFLLFLALLNLSFHAAGFVFVPVLHLILQNNITSTNGPQAQLPFRGRKFRCKNCAKMPVSTGNNGKRQFFRALRCEQKNGAIRISVANTRAG